MAHGSIHVRLLVTFLLFLKSAVLYLLCVQMHIRSIASVLLEFTQVLSL